MSDWQPGASRERLRARADLLRRLRAFFDTRGVLEVETPLLAQAGVTDPAIEPLMVTAGRAISGGRYLQTSPEYAMKRLLAAGSGPIFQICKAFRDGESGRRHNPEFTMLEWYRPGFSLEALMDEVEALVQACLPDPAAPAERRCYRELFESALGFDPLLAATADLAQAARARIDCGDMQLDRDGWLDLLMTQIIEPALPSAGRCFIVDYPASQAALARIDHAGRAPVARRFEFYVNGVELANGYDEETDALELRRRFEVDNARRASEGMPARALDERLLAATAHGMPACAGVALGLDRLLMLACGATSIDEVLAFSWDRA